MKQLLLIFSLLVVTAEGNAQKIRFTDTSNVWQAYHIGGGNLQDAYIEIITYSFAGDTLIDSKEYLIMVDTFWDWSYFQGFPIHYSGPMIGSKRFIHEDTLAKKVFVRLPNDTTEYILYDYNLQIGDTFQNWNARYVVSSIDSVLINNTFHKRWHYTYLFMGGSATSQYELIEGIGSREGPLNLNTFEDDWNLLCFSSANVAQSNLSIVSSHGCNMDSILSVTDVKSTSAAPVFCTPNPIISQAKISLPYSINNGELLITNISGKKIFTKNFTRKQELKIENTFIPGIYFFEVKDMDRHKTFFGKFISQ